MPGWDKLVAEAKELMLVGKSAHYAACYVVERHEIATPRAAKKVERMLLAAKRRTITKVRNSTAARWTSKQSHIDDLLSRVDIFG